MLGILRVFLIRVIVYVLCSYCPMCAIKIIACLVYSSASDCCCPVIVRPCFLSRCSSLRDKRLSVSYAEAPRLSNLASCGGCDTCDTCDTSICYGILML